MPNGGGAAEEDDSDVSEDEDGQANSLPSPLPDQTEEPRSKYVFSRDTILLLISYLIFQLSNVAFNSLFPVFAQTAPPTGRNLEPNEIGLSLSFAGLVAILFQVGIFGKLRDKMGSRWAYRSGFLGFVLSFIMMPWVEYKGTDYGGAGISSSKVWLWLEICFVLLVKTVSAVGGLASALLLVCVHLPALTLVNSSFRSRILLQTILYLVHSMVSRKAYQLPAVPLDPFYLEASLLLQLKYSPRVRHWHLEFLEEWPLWAFYSALVSDPQT